MHVTTMTQNLNFRCSMDNIINICIIIYSTANICTESQNKATQRVPNTPCLLATVELSHRDKATLKINKLKVTMSELGLALTQASPCTEFAKGT